MKEIKYSPRTKVRLEKWEIELLKEYMLCDPYAKRTIQKSTRINPRTVDRIIENGWTELAVAVRIKDFLNILKEEKPWKKGLPTKR